MPESQAGLQPQYVHAAAYMVRQIFPTGSEQAEALGLGEAAPHTVRFACRKSVCGALRPDRAGAADGLRGDLAPEAGCAPFAIGVKELSAVAPTARAVALPVPHLGGGPWQPAHIRHSLPSRADRRAHTC